MKKIIIIIILIAIGFSFIGCELWEENCPTCPRESTARKWTDGIVYYKFHDNVTEDAKDIIVDCMMDFEDISSLQFIEDDSKEYFVTIKLGNQNSISRIGMYKSILKLKTPCNRISIKHEIGHLIGLEHEHQREDRNENIEVVWDNIKTEKYYQFVKIKNDLIPEKMFIYDKYSIMHYSKKAHTKNNKETLKNMSIHDRYSSFIPSSNFSSNDILKIQYIYHF